VARILDLSKAIIQLSNLVADLEKMARELDANTLKVHTLRHLPNPGSLPEQ
jgi:hypothetical protein